SSKRALDAHGAAETQALMNLPWLSSCQQGLAAGEFVRECRRRSCGRRNGLRDSKNSGTSVCSPWRDGIEPTGERGEVGAIEAPGGRVLVQQRRPRVAGAVQEAVRGADLVVDPGVGSASGPLEHGARLPVEAPGDSCCGGVWAMQR